MDVDWCGKDGCFIAFSNSTVAPSHDHDERLYEPMWAGRAGSWCGQRRRPALAEQPNRSRVVAHAGIVGMTHG